MKEKLSVNTTSTNGKRTPNTIKGAVDVNILQGNGYAQIAIAADQRTDGKALINISGPDKVICFSGTFSELYDILNGRVSANEYTHIEEMLCPDMGDGTHNDIIRLKKGEVLSISEFNIEVYQSDNSYLQNHTPFTVVRPVKG